MSRHPFDPASQRSVGVPAPCVPLSWLPSGDADEDAGDHAQGASAASPRPTDTREPRYRPLVLVAEDDFDMRRLLVRALWRDGYDVREIESGSDLYDRLRSPVTYADPPALIVSDIRMPGLTGIEVVKALRDWGWTIPVVLITAFGDAATLEKASAAGANAVLTKPLAMDDLCMVASWLAPRRQPPVCAHSPGRRPNGAQDE